MLLPRVSGLNTSPVTFVSTVLAWLCIGLSVGDRSGAIVANPCPFEAINSDASVDPVALANRAVNELFPQGRIAEALSCHRIALSHVPSSMMTQPWVTPIKENLQNLEAILGPRRPGFPRVYHNVVGRSNAENGASMVSDPNSLCWARLCNHSCKQRQFMHSFPLVSSEFCSASNWST